MPARADAVDDLERDLLPLLDAPPLARDVDPARVGPYRGFAEVCTSILALRARGARVSIAGRSHEGAPILAVELGPEDAPQGSLAVAGIHAMEWIGIETMLGLLEAIAAMERPARRIVAFPVLNPDGMRRAEANLRAGRWRFVRANARGVDLNRNWPTLWRPTRLLPRVLRFLGGAGPRPASEPEVRAVLDAIERARRAGRPFDRALSLHSFGAMLLLPYGGRWTLPAEFPRLRSHASRVQRALRSRYGVRACARWYPGFFANGMEIDHFLREGMDPMLVECSRGGFSLADPSSWMHPFRWFNPRDPGEHTAELVRALLPFLGYGADLSSYGADR